jgi:hypothetical protein
LSSPSSASRRDPSSRRPGIAPISSNSSASDRRLGQILGLELVVGRVSLVSFAGSSCRPLVRPKLVPGVGRRRAIVAGIRREGSARLSVGSASSLSATL